MTDTYIGPGLIDDEQLWADLEIAHEALRTILRSCKLQGGHDGEPTYTVPFDALEQAYNIVGHPWPEQWEMEAGRD